MSIYNNEVDPNVLMWEKLEQERFETILKNAGYDERDMYPINMEIGKAKGVWSGFNIKEETIVNMKEAGIIDPHVV